MVSEIASVASKIIEMPIRKLVLILSSLIVMLLITVTLSFLLIYFGSGSLRVGPAFCLGACEASVQEPGSLPSFPKRVILPLLREVTVEDFRVERGDEVNEPVFCSGDEQPVSFGFNSTSRDLILTGIAITTDGSNNKGWNFELVNKGTRLLSADLSVYCLKKSFSLSE